MPRVLRPKPTDLSREASDCMDKDGLGESVERTQEAAIRSTPITSPSTQSARDVCPTPSGRVLSPVLARNLPTHLGRRQIMHILHMSTWRHVECGWSKRPCSPRAPEPIAGCGRARGRLKTPRLGPIYAHEGR